MRDPGSRLEKDAGNTAHRNLCANTTFLNEYKGSIKELHEQTFPASTFNTLIDAFTTVFIILANDGWSTIYVIFTRAMGSIKSTLYFLSLLVVGQYIVLNLFIAILILNFEEESASEA